MPVMPGAEPFNQEGTGPVGAVGVLVVHGFTGSPQSMRPWAEHLAEAGFTVSVPRLPGHGTRWQDMNATTWQDWFAEVERSFDALRARCKEVFVFGLSMGGTLTVRLAETRASEIAGIVIVNASLATERKDALLLPYLKNLIPSFPGIASDIKKPGVKEVAYDRLPLKAAHSLQQLWKVTRGELNRITCPVLAYRSATDHVVEAVSGRLLLEGLTATKATEVVLENSYHVATLDNDAPSIFEGSVAFIRQHSSAITVSGN